MAQYVSNPSLPAAAQYVSNPSLLAAAQYISNPSLPAAHARSGSKQPSPPLPTTRLPARRVAPPGSTLRPTAEAASETGTSQDGIGLPTATAHVATSTVPTRESNSGNRVAVGVGRQVSNPQTLSSNTSAAPPRWNTSHIIGVRRKNSSAIKLVVDVTAEGSEKLLAGLKDINDTARELKKEELALEMKIHEENLHYKQEKDKMLLENSKLALMNQTAMVAAMASLAKAIRGVRPTPECHSTTTYDEDPAGSAPDHGTKRTAGHCYEAAGTGYSNIDTST
jgi:hypothetical protein